MCWNDGGRPSQKGTVKILELPARDIDFGHNVIAGLQQAQSGDAEDGLQTLSEAVENARHAGGREVLMVAAILLAPLLVFWLKGAF